MKIKLHFYYICWIISIMYGCKNLHNQQNIDITEQWQNKKIIFPHTLQANDSIYDSLNKKTPYKIIRYIDSTDCLICNILLPHWERFYNQLNPTIPIHFFIHATKGKELVHRLKSENVHINIHFDKNDRLNTLNKFPKDEKFQAFLIDSNNQIIIIGDPIRNLAIQKLYIESITP